MRFLPTRLPALCGLPASLLLAGCLIWPACVRSSPDAAPPPASAPESAAPAQTVARAVASRPAEDFIESIGVNIHLHYLDTDYARFDDLVLPRLQELGVRHVRDDVIAVEKLRALAARGIRLLPLAAPEHWERLRELAPILSGLEGPNETDIFPFTYQGKKFPEGTRAFMADLHAFAKASPGLRALPLLVATTGRHTNGTVLGPVPGDAGNVHSYSGGRHPEAPDNLERFLRPARAVSGPHRAFYATECGYHTLSAGHEEWAQPGVSEAAAAKYIPRLLLHNFRSGIVRSYLYELLDTNANKPGLDGTGSESHYGLVRSDGTPKPSFTALRNLIRLLEDPGARPAPASLEFSLSSGAPVESLLLHRQDGSFQLVLWQAVPSFDLAAKKDLSPPDASVLLSFPAAVRELTLHRPLKSSQPLATHADLDSIVIPVPDHPVVVHIRPRPPERRLPDLVLRDHELLLPEKPGAPASFRAVVANIGAADVPPGTVIAVTAVEDSAPAGPASTRRLGTYGTTDQGLPAGATVTIRPNDDSPRWLLGDAARRIVLVLDDVDRIEESDETNNTHEVPLP